MNDGTRSVSCSTSTTTCRLALAARYSLRSSSDFSSTGPLRSTVFSLNGFSAGISAGSEHEQRDHRREDQQHGCGKPADARG